MASLDATSLNVATYPQAINNTISCQCQASFVQLVLLLAVVIGIPIAACISIYTIRFHFVKNWDHVDSIAQKRHRNSVTAEAAEATLTAAVTEANFDAETAFDAEALGIPQATEAFSSNEHGSEYETNFSDVISVQPYSILEPPSPCSSRRSPGEATTLKSHYGRPPPRSSRWATRGHTAAHTYSQRATNRGRPSGHFYREQRPETEHPKRNPFATLRAYSGSPPITSSRFDYGRPQGNVRDNTQPRRPNRKRNWRPRQSRFSRATQLVLLAAIILTCTVTSCNATDPVAAPAAPIFAGASRTLLALLLLLTNSLGKAFDSPHGETPPTDATDADEIPLYTPQTDWRIISGPPAEYDLNLDVPLPTPPPPPPPSPPPPSSPPSANNFPHAALSTPNLAPVFSRYPTDTTIFVVFKVYAILFETTTSAPSWMPAATRYDKIRLTKAIRDASRRYREAVIVINSDLPENTAVSIGRLLRQLNSVAELLLPSNPPFLLQVNAFAFISLRSAFPAVVQTMTFAADSIRTATDYATRDQQLYATLQAVLSAPILKGYSDEDVATSLSRRAPPPKEHSPGNSSQLGK